MLSVLAGITLSACQPIGSLICYLYILSIAGSNWLARSHLINLWTCTRAKQISQAVVFVDLVHANIVPTPSAEREFFVNWSLGISSSVIAEFCRDVVNLVHCRPDLVSLGRCRPSDYSDPVGLGCCYHDHVGCRVRCREITTLGWSTTRSRHLSITWRELIGCERSLQPSGQQPGVGISQSPGWALELVITCVSHVASMTHKPNLHHIRMPVRNHAGWSSRQCSRGIIH